MVANMRAILGKVRVFIQPQQVRCITYNFIHFNFNFFDFNGMKESIYKFYKFYKSLPLP